MARTPEESPDVAGRKKIFAYYLYDHHGDGRIAVWCKASPGEQGRLVEENPRRYFVPSYLGPRGWVGVRLDMPAPGWRAIKQLVLVAYHLTAPSRLRRQPGQTAARTQGKPARRPSSRSSLR